MIASLLFGVFSTIAASKEVRIESTGAISPPVYRHVLEGLLGPDWIDQDQLAIRLALLGFLKDTGYELAQVEMIANREGGLIRIDEGVLDSIVFPNVNGLQAFSARTYINLPAQAYNRLILRDELEGLENLLGVPVERVEVVALDDDERTEAILENEAELRRFIGRSLGDYQLRVYLRTTPFSRGWRVGFRGESPDGLVINTSYKTPPIVVDDDSLEAAVEFGIRSSSQPTGLFSRGGLRLSWISPAIFSERLRLRLGAQGSVIQRGRPDLDVDRFAFLDIRPSFGVDYELSERLELALRAGLQTRELLGIEAEDITRVVLPINNTRPFVSIDSELLFGSPTRRAPYRHEIDVEAGVFLGERKLLSGFIEYAKALAFGWDGLFVEAALEFAAFGPALSEERRVSDRLLGAFGDDIYSKLFGSLSLDYRIAFGRDRFAFGPIAAGVVYEDVGQIGLGSSLGAGLHGRLFDNFSVSFYAFTALATGRRDTFGVSFGIEQVF